jgi:glutaminase
VLPGQLGIGVFSPPLDARGNSVRGIRVCQELSRHLDLHLFNRPAIGKFTIRLKFTGAELNSSRVRTPDESRVLRECGHGIKVYQLQGNLNFTTAEVVVRDIIEGMESIEHLIVDFKRVLGINESACRLLCEVVRKLSHRSKSVLFAHANRAPLLRRYMKVRLGPRFEELFREFDDLDPAQEWCENRLLESALPGWSLDRSVLPERYDLFESFSAKEIAVLTALLKHRTYQRGETIINLGDEAREMFFIARGSVSVTISLPSGTEKRLATFSAGMAFGEMALIDGAPRSARIVADSEVKCDLLTSEDFEQLGSTHPGLKIKLLENLCLGFCRKLRKANRQMSVFD